MKLSQLYSNLESFKDIEFNEGLNIILGKVVRKYDINKDSHNLGKSTLISVLDFMFLKQIDKNHFFRQFETAFDGVIIYLELKLDSGKYLTLRRAACDSNKVSFKINNQKTRMTDDFDWDLRNQPLVKSVKLLNEYLNFNVLNSSEYRKSITYFLRSQSDYRDIFQLGKFQNGKHIDWKPFMFDLLGFNGRLLEEKYNIDNQIDKQQEFINSIKKEFSVDASEIDRIKGNITLKRTELDETKQLFDNFNFYQQERTLNKNLIENIESAIAELNSLDYTLSFELDKVQQSISNSTSFDIEQLQEIYADVKIYFPDAIIQDYKSLEKFNKDITDERNKYLRERVTKLTIELKQTREQLLSLNKQRTDVLSILHNKDTFKKFKEYQYELAKLEGNISLLEEQLKNIDKISAFKDIISDLKDKSEDITKKIRDHITSQDSAIYNEIRKVFNNVFKTVFNVPALLYVEPNSVGNVDFKSQVKTEDDSKITAESNGNTYKKMLCVAFDLALLIAYNQNSFYKFVYHDGVLEGLDNRKKNSFIKLVRDYCNKYDIQYIFTSIDDDLPFDLLSTFSNEEKCLILNDSGDEGKLFGFSF